MLCIYIFQQQNISHADISLDAGSTMRLRVQQCREGCLPFFFLFHLSLASFPAPEHSTDSLQETSYLLASHHCKDSTKVSEMVGQVWKQTQMCLTFLQGPIPMPIGCEKLTQSRQLSKNNCLNAASQIRVRCQLCPSQINKFVDRKFTYKENWLYQNYQIRMYILKLESLTNWRINGREKDIHYGNSVLVFLQEQFPPLLSLHSDIFMALKRKIFLKQPLRMSPDKGSKHMSGLYTLVAGGS